MLKFSYKINVLCLLLSIILVAFSCTKIERSAIIKNELSRNDSAISVTNNTIEEYKYIINKRTGKIHTYSDGINRVSEKYQLMTNENIEKLLENENYDICLNCRAGLKLNLDAFVKRANDYNDDDDLSNREVNLIKKYMRLYEFGQLDAETQKFLICLFKVSSWYINNVYTHLGGKKNILEVENIAKASASNAAYKKWRNFLDREYYNKYPLRYEKRILPVIYDENNNPTDMVLYRCDLFKDAGYGKGNNIYSKTGMQIIKNAEGEELFNEWKNYCVADDSSKFAATVYYHYINKEILKNEKEEDRIAYGIDLWNTGTLDFSSEKAVIVNKLVKDTKRFKFYSKSKIIEENNKYKRNEAKEKFNLKIGDLIYKPKTKVAEGNVEFYIGNNKVVGWGHINNTYVTKKIFRQDNNEFYSDYLDDKKMPYTSILRFRGEN